MPPSALADCCAEDRHDRSDPASTETLWIHGDLRGRNTLAEGGKITGIIDWGDVTSGEAATDLASIWRLFAEPSARHEAPEAYDPDAGMLCRA